MGNPGVVVTFAVVTCWDSGSPGASPGAKLRVSLPAASVDVPDSAGAAPVRPTCLVRLQPDGHRLPIFLVHQVGGYAWTFRALARELGNADLGPLAEAWGFRFDAANVVVDLENALMVNTEYDFQC